MATRGAPGPLAGVSPAGALVAGVPVGRAAEGERPTVVGVLALQGDVREHEAALRELGVGTRQVRLPADLEGLDGIVLPGGESTTLSMLLESSKLFVPLAEAVAGGLPVLGTCAGMILLAQHVEDGRPDQRTLGALACTVRRNGYGPQRYSFEALVDASRVVAAADGADGAPDGPSGAGDAPAGAGDGPVGRAGTGTALLPAVFIRAPVVTDVGTGVEVLARLATPGDAGPGDPVVCRQRNVLAAAFHPELTSDRRLHQLFVDMVRAARAGIRR